MFEKRKGVLIVLIALGAISLEIQGSDKAKKLGKARVEALAAPSVSICANEQLKESKPKVQKKNSVSVKIQSGKSKKLGKACVEALAAPSVSICADEQLKESKSKEQKKSYFFNPTAEECEEIAELHLKAAKRYKREGERGEDFELLWYAIDSFKAAAELFEEAKKSDSEKECYKEAGQVSEFMAKIAVSRESEAGFEGWDYRDAAKYYSLCNHLVWARDCYQKAIVAFEKIIERLVARESKDDFDFTLNALEECREAFLKLS